MSACREVACSQCPAVFTTISPTRDTCSNRCYKRKARRDVERPARKPVTRKPTAAQQPRNLAPAATRYEAPETEAYRWDVKSCHYCLRRGRFPGYYCGDRCEEAAKAPAGWDGRSKARPYTSEDFRE